MKANKEQITETLDAIANYFGQGDLPLPSKGELLHSVNELLLEKFNAEIKQKLAHLNLAEIFVLSEVLTQQVKEARDQERAAKREQIVDAGAEMKQALQFAPANVPIVPPPSRKGGRGKTPDKH